MWGDGYLTWGDIYGVYGLGCFIAFIVMMVWASDTMYDRDSLSVYEGAVLIVLWPLFTLGFIIYTGLEGSYRLLRRMK